MSIRLSSISGQMRLTTRALVNKILMIENGKDPLITGKRLFVKTGPEFIGNRALKGSQVVMN